MTVKELMRDVNVNRVVDAFLLLDYNFSESNYESSFFEKFQAIPRIRDAIAYNARLLAECKPNEDAESYTIFVWYHPDEEDFEQVGKRIFTSIAFCDAEIQAVIGSDPFEFTSYCYNASLMRDLAAHRIAEVSIKELGKEVCAAKILSEVFWWGAYPEEREENVKRLYARAARPITEKDLIDSRTFEENMKGLDEEIKRTMSDEQREYRHAQQEFESKTEEIRTTYRRKVSDEFFKQVVDAIKKEYLLDTYNARGED